MGQPYPKNTRQVAKTLAGQIEQPVRFGQCVEQAYENGGRVFVEIGPGKTLTNLTDKILAGKEHYTVAINGFRGAGSAHLQLEEALVWLRVLGLAISGDPYRLSASELDKEEKPKSAFLISPKEYVTPQKAKIASEALEQVDPVYEPPVSQIHTNNIADDHLKGVIPMGNRAMDSILGIQSLNGQVMEKFFASQSYQINILKDLLQENKGAARTNELVHLIETFQNNSMKAFESYMEGQRGILHGQEWKAGAILEQGQTTRPTPDQAWQPSPPAIPFVPVEPKNGQAWSSDLTMDITTISSKLPINSQSLATREVSLDIDLIQVMLQVISEKTGYPVEMVDPDMNFESDLGIDSIKRVEIFAELNELYPGIITNEDVEDLSNLYTVHEVADFIKKKA
jgi:acyl carrier protein